MNKKTEELIIEWLTKSGAVKAFENLRESYIEHGLMADKEYPSMEHVVHNVVKGLPDVDEEELCTSLRASIDILWWTTQLAEGITTEMFPFFKQEEVVKH